MSLRQRSQRPSEASNESGWNSSDSRQSSSASYSGGHAPPQPRSNTMHHHASSVGHSGGGYYNSAGYVDNPATPSTLRTSTGYQASPRVIQQPASLSSRTPNTSAGGYYRNESMPAASAPRGGGVAPYGSSSGFDYAGYSNRKSSVNNSMGSGLPSSATNPYQKPKSSSSVTFQRVFLGLLALTCLVLAGAGIHLRGVLKEKDFDLRNQKRILELRRRDEDGERATRERYRPRQNPGKEQPQAAHDVHEKEQLEDDIRKLRAEVENHKTKHRGILDQKQAQTENLQGLMAKKSDLQKTIEHSRNMLEDAKEETGKYKAMVGGMGAVEDYMTKREDALWGRIDNLETRIARDSRREATEWFGPGPHRVAMDVEYPKVQQTNSDASTWPRTRGTIILEMAPLDLMPHVVNLFLQQVHHRLWNSCTVVSSATHIFQLAPSYKAEDATGDGNVSDTTKTHYDHFRAKGLDKVSYQEYSAQYPHEQWTAGLAGRPGGPDFYLNKRNNTQIHGPGGQLNKHDLHNEADPCFGRLVEGHEILTEIETVPTDPENNYALKYPVTIVEARVLVRKENHAEGWQAVPPGEKFDHGQILPLPDIPHGS